MLQLTSPVLKWKFPSASCKHVLAQSRMLEMVSYPTHNEHSVQKAGMPWEGGLWPWVGNWNITWLEWLLSPWQPTALQQDMPKKNWIKSKVLLPLWRLISTVLHIIVMKPSILGFPQAYGEYGCLGQDSTPEEEEVLSHFNDCINNVSLLDKRLYISADVFSFCFTFSFFLCPSITVSWFELTQNSILLEDLTSEITEESPL